MLISWANKVHFSHATCLLVGQEYMFMRNKNESPPFVQNTYEKADFFPSVMCYVYYTMVYTYISLSEFICELAKVKRALAGAIHLYSRMTD